MKHDHAVRAAVRAELARRDLNQEHVAEVLGITRQAVSRRLTGQVPFVVDELYKIAELCGIPVSVLIPDAPDQRAAS